MTGHFPSLDSLPPRLPIFPLSGVLLLPQGILPLNIFEPRYISMVEDALGRPDRLIGMIQPKGLAGAREERAQPLEGEPVFDIGCAGRITAMDEAEDGRYLITLTGVCRFRISSEGPGIGGYRLVEADWSRFAGDLHVSDQSGLDRDRLAAALTGYFERNNIDADWQAIRDAPDERLVTSLCMICPFEPREKQALLECVDLAQRSELMTSLIEMAAIGGHTPDQGSRH